MLLPTCAKKKWCRHLEEGAYEPRLSCRSCSACSVATLPPALLSSGHWEIKWRDQWSKWSQVLFQKNSFQVSLGQPSQRCLSFCLLLRQRSPSITRSPHPRPLHPQCLRKPILKGLEVLSCSVDHLLCPLTAHSFLQPASPFKGEVQITFGI